MSILSGFSKIKKYKKINDNNYKLQSQWTSASTVEMADGKTLQETLNSLNTNSSSSVVNTKAGCLKNGNNIYSRYNMYISKDENGVIYISGISTIKRTNAPSYVSFDIALITKQELIDMGFMDSSKNLSADVMGSPTIATTYTSDGSTYKIGMSEFATSTKLDGWAIQIAPPTNTRNIVVPFSFYLY